MVKSSFLPFLCLSFIVASTLSLVCNANDESERKLHIVYMGSLPNGDYSPSSHHLSMIQQVLESGDDASNHLIRSYTRSFNGFAAMLTDQQRQQISNMEGVVSVFPSKRLELHTTRSWDFLGLKESTRRNQTGESDVIIGVLDTGIWPESPSFDPKGFGPVPKKWRGDCKGGKNFTCNNKIIGARYYGSEEGLDSARDTTGHGSHTASTAAGNLVKTGGFYSVAGGDARGGAPSARIAAYKICSELCSSADVMSAFDDSIADGVDLISISLGYNGPLDFKEDAISIGAFHAMEKGILTINSAGNGGSSKGSTASLAPWLLSVAASTTDRSIIDKFSLGNGVTLSGKGINTFKSKGRKIPLVTARFASEKSCSGEELEACYCLDTKLVKGKIVCCNDLNGYQIALTAGAYGSILKADKAVSLVNPYPSLLVDSKTYDLVLSYANSTTSHQGEILTSEAIMDTTAPLVADFSSRGPNRLVPEILKPDVTAPGVEILAAYSPLTSPSGFPQDTRSVDYNILSGTSMSCPHVSGIAAYVKSSHPDWSPAAIKSSIMTTAKPLKVNEDQNVYAYGSGHVDPLKAIDPGLVFDLSKEDYLSMLCNLGYDTKTVRKISGDKSTCPSSSPQRSKLNDVNYPSIAAQVKPMKPFAIKFTRTVTNVGFANSTYEASVQTSSGINVTVVPQVLSFKSLKEKKSFVVSVVGGKFKESVVSASLLWKDGTHSVRCPIAIDVAEKE